jgi:leucyl-tRNA synthetase
VTTETEEMRFNTAIAAMMEFVNTVYKWPNRYAGFAYQPSWIVTTTYQ